MANNGRVRSNALHAMKYECTPLALSANGVHAAVTLTASAQDVTTGITNPTVPRVLSIAGNVASTVQATLSTALAGANNDLDFTAVPVGALGNLITIEYLDPGANDAVESIDVVGNAITVNLATDGSGVITSTGDTIKATLLADAPASALVTAADKAANDGSGLVIAMAATALTGGITKSTGNVVVTGRNMRNAVITDTIALNGTTTVAGVKAFAFVDSVNYPARHQTGDTVVLGTTDLLGLPSTLSFDSVLFATYNGVREATAPTVTADADELEKNVIDLDTVLAGAAVKVVYLMSA